MTVFSCTYKLYHSYAPWHKYIYQVKNNDTILYQVPRNVIRKYQEFKDLNGETIYQMGTTSLKEINNDSNWAVLQSNGKVIATSKNTFTIDALNMFERSYVLKLDDETLVQVKRENNPRSQQHIIEMKDVDEQSRTFLLALIVLIDSFLQIIQNPIMYPSAACSYVSNYPLTFIKMPEISYI